MSEYNLWIVQSREFFAFEYDIRDFHSWRNCKESYIVWHRIKFALNSIRLQSYSQFLSILLILFEYTSCCSFRFRFLETEKDEIDREKCVNSEEKLKDELKDDLNTNSELKMKNELETKDEKKMKRELKTKKMKKKKKMKDRCRCDDSHKNAEVDALDILNRIDRRVSIFWRIVRRFSLQLNTLDSNTDH